MCQDYETYSRPQISSLQGDDGALLASVCDEGVRVYDADHRYKVVQELEKVWRPWVMVDG